MKKYCTIIFFLTVLSGQVFAQRGMASGMSSGSIQFVSSRPDMFQINISGPFTFRENVAGGFLLGNLFPGDYLVKISIQSGRRNTVIYNQNVRLQPGQRAILTIGSGNRVAIGFTSDPNSVVLCADGRGSQWREPAHSISDENLNRILVELNKCAFDSDKQKVLDVSAVHHFFLSDQLGRIMTTFRSDDSKLQCAKMLLPKILDPENLYLQANVFTFTSSKDSYLNLIRPR